MLGCLRESLRRGIAFIWGLGHGPLDDFVKLARDVGLDLEQVRYGFSHMLNGQANTGIGVIWRITREHLKEDDAQRVNICAAVDIL